MRDPGPEAVEVELGVRRLDCATRQGVDAAPQVVADVDREYCVVRTAVILPRLKMLNASTMHGNFIYSPAGTFFVKRGSQELRGFRRMRHRLSWL